MKATTIIWDDDDKRDLKLLPTEMDIPDEIDADNEDTISEYLSEQTGYCHKGFLLEK